MKEREREAGQKGELAACGRSRSWPLQMQLIGKFVGLCP